MLLENKKREEFLESLTKTEKKIYFTLIKNKDDISEKSAKSIAQECYCTTTTVNRLCKKLGYQGFLDYKNYLMYNQDKVLKVEVEDNYAINGKSFILDSAELLTFSSKLRKDKKIFIFAIGASSITGLYLERLLLMTGYQVLFSQDIYFIERLMSEQIIVISNTGQSIPCLDVIVSANEKNIETFTITAAGSPLYSLSKYKIGHNYEVDKSNVVSRENQIYIINVVNQLLLRI